MTPEQSEESALESTAAPLSIRRYGLELALACLVIAIYAQTAAFDFVSYDDIDYVSENPRIALTAENVRWALTSGHLCNWHPLTWISFMLDHAVFGIRPGAHHLVNVAIHLLSTLVLYRAFRRMTGAVWQSALVAAVFAAHPAHVESVAWISERKDVLSTGFGILTLWAYARYAQRPAIGRYLPVMAFMALSLMSKSMLVTLPCVLLLLDYWPLRRLDGVRKAGWLALEKAPLFAMSLGAGLLALQFKTGQVVALETRLLNVPVAYGQYLLKSFVPVNLMVHYEIPMTTMASGALWASVGAVTMVTVLALATWRRWPHVMVGWLWFVGTLVPVAGAVQLGNIGWADRYLYFPLIGLSAAVIWGAAAVVPSRVPRTAITLLAGLLVAAMTVLSFLQVRHWRTTETLFAHAVAVSPCDALSRYNLGCELVAQERFEEAEPHLEAAAQLNDSDVNYLNNLGLVKTRLGKLEEALTHYYAALTHEPDHVPALINAGYALNQLGRYAEAETYLVAALAVEPQHAEARFNLAGVYYKQARYTEAVSQLTQTLRAQADHINAAYLLAHTFSKMGQAQAAAGVAQQILQIQPDHAGAKALLEQGGADASGGKG